MADEIRIVRGRPTDEELAAIVGVLYSIASAPDKPAQPPRSRWAHSTRPSHRLGVRGGDAWRASALPGRH